MSRRRQAASCSILARRAGGPATAAEVAAISASSMGTIVPPRCSRRIGPILEPAMEDTHDGDRDPVAELDRQVERASLFTHASFDRIASRASGIQAELHELVDVLRSKGVLSEDDLGKPEVPPGAGVEGGGAPRVPWPTIALRTDQGEGTAPVEVNCAERMHACHAVCCKLHFALTAGEVDAGKVRFDLGFPHLIRHDSDGYCTHNDRTTGSCGVYADRPRLLRH